MPRSNSGYHCPQCQVVNTMPTDQDRSFTCPQCRTAVALVGETSCFYGSVDGTEAPLRSDIEAFEP